ncbi:MAG: transporter substrate-binding domain-containing protein [Veillonella sp.]|nr:transporter substrate-binding domain-containing protein [Veillonella sp.]
MKLKKSLALVLGATLMIGVFAGCGSEQAPKKDTIKFAAETTYPPFEFADGDKYQGFDVDLANAIGKETGKKVEFVSMGFDALIPALQSGQIDAIASGMVITKERLEKIDFSDPYYQVNLIMVVKRTIILLMVKLILPVKL